MTVLNDLYSILTARVVMGPKALADNTPQVGSIIDMKGYEAVVFLTAIGALPDADATFTAKLEHGDDPALADAAECTAGQLIGTAAGASFTFAADNTTRKLGYKGGKRYVRYTLTPANLATGAELVGVIAVLGGARSSPPA